jgi:hypothetical protein
MLEIERAIYFVCGKCESAGVYKDGDGSLACLMCGNRYEEVLPGVTRGVAPKKIYKKEDVMSRKGKCAECGRDEMGLVAKGLCGRCYLTAKKAEGREAKGLLCKREPQTQVKIEHQLTQQPAREIPVTITLTIDVKFRVNGVAAC